MCVAVLMREATCLNGWKKVLSGALYIHIYKYVCCCHCCCHLSPAATPAATCHRNWSINLCICKTLLLLLLFSGIYCRFYVKTKLNYLFTLVVTVSLHDIMLCIYMHIIQSYLPRPCFYVACGTLHHLFALLISWIYLI